MAAHERPGAEAQPIGTRRRLMTLLAGLPVAGALLAALGEEAVGAERPSGRLRGRSTRRAQHRRASRRRRNNDNDSRDQKNEGKPPGASAGARCLGPNELCDATRIIINEPCCEARGLVCTPSIFPLITSCRKPCTQDSDCFGFRDGITSNCVANLEYCPFLHGGKCCE